MTEQQSPVTPEAVPVHPSEQPNTPDHQDEGDEPYTVPGTDPDEHPEQDEDAE